MTSKNEIDEIEDQCITCRKPESVCRCCADCGYHLDDHCGECGDCDCDGVCDDCLNCDCRCDTD